LNVFTYSEARQNLAQLLILAQSEEVEIRCKDGTIFSLVEKRQSDKSPFDVPGVQVSATIDDILDAVRESRAERY